MRIYIRHKTIYKGTHSTRPLVTPQYVYIKRFVVCTVSFSIISRETFTLRNPIGIRYYFIYIYACGLPTTKPWHHKEEKKTVEKYTRIWYFSSRKSKKKYCIYSLARIHHSLCRTSCYNQYIHHRL